MNFCDCVTHIHKAIDEKDYGELKAKQASITDLFPTFYDRVKKVAKKGGVKLYGVEKDEWSFNVSSATIDHVSYRNIVRFRGIEDDIKKQVADKRTWTKDGSKVDRRLLATQILYGTDMELLCVCPAFLYWGSSYILTQRQAKWTNPEDRRPVVRNPKEFGAMCKHMQLVFDVLPFYYQTMAKYITAYYDSVVTQAEEEVRRQEQAAADQEGAEGDVEGQEPGNDVPPKPDGWQDPFSEEENI